MKPAIDNALARQHAGELSPVCHRNGNRHDRPPRPDTNEVESQIAGLANRSTPDLRIAWRQLHRTGPPLGLSRDLLIRALANQLQEQSYGGVSRALRRRLQSLASASENDTMAVDPGLVLKAGTTLVRQWRGHTHTVLVHNDGALSDLERRCRSLGVIGRLPVISMESQFLRIWGRLERFIVTNLPSRCGCWA